MPAFIRREHIPEGSATDGFSRKLRRIYFVTQWIVGIVIFVYFGVLINAGLKLKESTEREPKGRQSPIYFFDSDLFGF